MVLMIKATRIADSNLWEVVLYFGDDAQYAGNLFLCDEEWQRFHYVLEVAHNAVGDSTFDLEVVEG